jgi:tetratricopeptide (TPR) repeat protein
MKRLHLVLLSLTLLISVTQLANGDLAEILEEVDRLDDGGDAEAAIALLNESSGSFKSDEEKAEYLWRLSRSYLGRGDDAEERGDSKSEMLGIFTEGEALAENAIQSDPLNKFAYFWKAANIGRAGQIRGVLNSLFSARPMRNLLVKALEIDKEYADVYYVLGQMYEQLPGFISFGNKDFAVSLGRKAVDLHEEQLEAGIEDILNYDFYTELAKHLWARNWPPAKRKNEQRKKQSRHARARNALEDGVFYEGVSEIQDISDREEALSLIRWVIRELESIAGHTEDQEKDFEEAKEVIAEMQR